MAAKKQISTSTRGAAAKKEAAPAVTPIRNTAIPKPQPVATKSGAITHEMIAKRAYEISQSPQCGSEYDNWIRAERELRGGR
jgi:hypothetical protein